jgi:hypothetical protein
VTGEIGGRRGERHARKLDQPLCNRMNRKADRDRLKAAAARIRNRRLFFHNHRQRARPVARRKLPRALRNFLHNIVEHLHPADMHDQGVISRAALRGKNIADGILVKGVRREAVDRLRRHSHEAAVF